MANLREGTTRVAASGVTKLIHDVYLVYLEKLCMFVE